MNNYKFFAISVLLVVLIVVFTLIVVKMKTDSEYVVLEQSYEEVVNSCFDYYTNMAKRGEINYLQRDDLVNVCINNRLMEN